MSQEIHFAPAPLAPTDGQLKDVLKMVEKGHQNKAADAKFSGEMLEIGSKTQTATYWANVLTDPITVIHNNSLDIDKAFRAHVNTRVQLYFDTLKDIVSHVYRTDTGRDDLHYCIVLKKDTMKNRMKVNEFFSSYYAELYAEKYPVYFQVIPAALKSKIKYRQQLF